MPERTPPPSSPPRPSPESLATWLELGLLDAALDDALALGAAGLDAVADGLTALAPSNARPDLLARVAARRAALALTGTTGLAPSEAARALAREALAAAATSTGHADAPAVLAARGLALALLDAPSAATVLRALAHGPGFPVLSRRVPWAGRDADDDALVDLALLEHGRPELALARARARTLAAPARGPLLHLATVVALTSPDALATLGLDPSDRAARRLADLVRLGHGELPAAAPRSDDAADAWLAARKALLAKDLATAHEAARQAVTSEPPRDAYWRTLADVELARGDGDGAALALGHVATPTGDDLACVGPALATARRPLGHEPTWQRLTDRLGALDPHAAAHLAADLARASTRPGPWVSRELALLTAIRDHERARNVARLALARGLDDGQARHWRALLGPGG